jgi:hypothetical protein
VKLTFIWQWKHYAERDWVSRVFEPFTGEQVYDCEHRIVLDDCLLIDAYPRAHPIDYFRQFRGKNAWLVHLCDETYDGAYQIYDNFRGVFRFYWSGIFNPRRVLQLPLGFQAGFAAARSAQASASKRPHLWSFLGGAGQSSRPEMVKAIEPLAPHLLHITDRGQVERLGKSAYEQILRDSVFAPCPMGNVNLESFRVYEALECGAIPVLEKRLGFDYFHNLLGDHPMPTFQNWRQAAQFIANLRSDSDALNRLHSQCVEWWKGYKNQLTTRIERFLAAPAGEEAGPYIHWRWSIPGAQAAELMRHHTVPALMRRVKVQSRRVLHEGKLRKTTGA